MQETILQVWKLEDAPANLRRLVPQAYPGWWLAFIRPGGTDDVVERLMNRWTASGSSVTRYDVETGGVVLVGPVHPD